MKKLITILTITASMAALTKYVNAGRSLSAEDEGALRSWALHRDGLNQRYNAKKANQLRKTLHSSKISENDRHEKCQSIVKWAKWHMRDIENYYAIIGQNLPNSRNIKGQELKTTFCETINNGAPSTDKHVAFSPTVGLWSSKNGEELLLMPQDSQGRVNVAQRFYDPKVQASCSPKASPKSTGLSFNSGFGYDGMNSHQRSSNYEQVFTAEELQQHNLTIKNIYAKVAKPMAKKKCIPKASEIFQGSGAPTVSPKGKERLNPTVSSRTGYAKMPQPVTATTIVNKIFGDQPDGSLEQNEAFKAWLENLRNHFKLVAVESRA